MISVETEGRAVPTLPVWKRVTLGRHKDAAGYLAALRAGGNSVSEYAKDIIVNMSIAPVETPVDLVLVAVRAMISPNGATSVQIYAWAEERGLESCPAEVGPALREHYRDQPAGEVIRVGMEPTDSDNYARVLFVHRGSFIEGRKRWLSTPGAFHDPNNRLGRRNECLMVLVRPNK